MSNELEGGIICGSGLYRLPIEGRREKVVNTPFGDVSLAVGRLKGKRVGFLPRHGPEHTEPPSQISYRANIFSLFTLGADWVLTTSAVGSLKRAVDVGSFVILDQIIDFTKHRTDTFFQGNFSVEMPDERIKSGVVHTDMTQPYCEKLRKAILEAATTVVEDVYSRGTYICTEGPRFETASEIDFFSQLGDVIGMTQAPEVFLANELELCYATIATVTNYAAGMQEEVTHTEVINVIDERREDLIKLIKATLELL